ncbi:hypothetical protein ES705_35961 [subsurface metagenome]
MRAGDLRHRITFYSKTIGKDVYGAATESDPAELFSVRAKVRYLRGDEILLSSTTANTTTLQFIIRQRNDISEEMEIEYEGSRYNIQVIEVAERSTLTKITAVKIVN